MSRTSTSLRRWIAALALALAFAGLSVTQATTAVADDDDHEEDSQSDDEPPASDCCGGWPW